MIARYGLIALAAGAGIEGETVVIAGGLLAHQRYFPLAGAMAAAAAGSFVADQIFFMLGRNFRNRAWVRRVRKRPLFDRALGMLERHPIGFIFAFRFMYGFRTISPIAIGTTGISARLFVIVNLVSAIVWGIAFTTIGYLFGHGLEALIGRLLPDRHVILILAAIVIAIAALVGAWHWRRSRNIEES